MLSPCEVLTEADDEPVSRELLEIASTEAGMLATLAMLHGSGAELFLDEMGVKYWCDR